MKAKRLSLVCALFATTLPLASCEGARFTRDMPADRAQECRQMQHKLATDQTLTPTQNCRNHEEHGKYRMWEQARMNPKHPARPAMTLAAEKFATGLAKPWDSGRASLREASGSGIARLI